MNCENTSFTAYIDKDLVYKDDGSSVLAFRRRDWLYGDASKALVNAIALIHYLEKYMDMYIEKVKMALQ